MTLAGAIHASARIGLRARIGQVSAVGTGVVTVIFGDGVTAVPNLPTVAGYTPIVGDMVFVERLGTASLVLGPL